MELSIDILQKALYELHDLHGHTYSEITKASGVHNVSRIIKGDITPYLDSWWSLHKAYPKYIPEPQYRDGSKVYKNVTASNHSHAAGHNMEVTNNHHSPTLSPEEQTLINLLREKDPTHIYLRRSIAELIMREDPEK